MQSIKVRCRFSFKDLPKIEETNPSPQSSELVSAVTPRRALNKIISAITTVCEEATWRLKNAK